MAGWTDHPESKQRCDGPLGPVASEEPVAKLLHSRNDEPRRKPFSRGHLFANDEFTNECGKSDGSSVDRIGGLEEIDVQRRAEAFATEREGRTSSGARVAKVADLRALSLPEQEGQLVFVYDDPMDGNERHAVIRGRLGLHRADQNRLRDDIVDAFRTVVSPLSSINSDPQSSSSG